MSQAVRGRVIGKYLGQLLLVLGCLNLLPAFVALLAGELSFVAPYVLASGAFVFTGWLLSRLGSPERMQANEALVISALAFVIAPLVMSYPLSTAGIPFIDALFEAVSGVTTTGLSTLASVEDKPYAFLFARAWMQWYGGLGMVVLSLALIIRPGALARQLSASAAEYEDLVGSTRTHARNVLGVYALLTLAGTVALIAVGTAPFDALVHVLAAVSTGGFSDRDDSLAGLGGWAAVGIVTLVCLSCSVSLTLYRRARRHGWRELFADLQLRTIVVLSVVVAALLMPLHPAPGFGWGTSAAHGLAMALSAQTTTGFSTLDVGSLHEAAKLVLIVSMFIGGGVGSTAGGMKILRLLMFVRVAQMMVARASLPRHAVVDVRLGGQRLDTAEVRDALAVALLFLCVVVASWLLFLAFGHAPLDSLFEVVSATATVGLSAGLTSPDLESLLKAVLCIDMLFGRLEIVAFLVVLYPRTWFGRRSATS